MSDTNWTFTSTVDHFGDLRRWWLRGPNGIVKFEIVIADHITTKSVHVHAVVPPIGCELEPCELCGKCWHDSLSGERARKLHERWEGAGFDDAVIREHLERWYNEELSTPVPVSEGSQVSGSVGPVAGGPQSNLAATGAEEADGFRPFTSASLPPAPVAAQPRYILDAPAILDMVGRYAEACVAAATTGSPKGREDAREQIRDLWDAIRAALTPVPDVEPEPAWGSGPLVDHNPETPAPATCDTCGDKGVIGCHGAYPGGPTACIDCHGTGEMPCPDCPGTGSADPDGGQR